MKKLMFVLLTVVMLTGIMMFAVAAETEGDYEYTVNGAEAVIDCYYGEEVNLVIPSTLGGYPVTKIGDAAFLGMMYTETVIVPEGVTSIGYDSFGYSDCLRSISLPSTLTQLGESTFYASVNLENITLAEANTSFVVIDNVLFSKDMSILYAYAPTKTDTSYTLPPEVKIIMESAFSFASNLSELQLNEGLVEIKDFAFDGTSITQLTLPASFTTYTEYSFVTMYSLEEIRVDEANTAFASKDGVLYTKDMSTLVMYPAAREGEVFTVDGEVKVISFSAFRETIYLTELIISEGLLNIEETAFDSSSIEKITIPSTASFELQAIMGAYNIKDIQIAEGHSTYAAKDGVIYSADMKELLYYPQMKPDEEFSIPEGVNVIDMFAFCQDNEYLSILNLPASLTNIEEGSFSVLFSLTDINVNEANTVYYSEDGVLFSGDTILMYPLNKADNVYILPEKITKIGIKVFCECTNLKSLILHDGITEIGGSCFWGSDNFAVYASEGGIVEEYALENYINYFPLSYLEMYSDVDAGLWYTKDVFAATQLKLMSGTGNGKFNPKGKLTREQFVQILFNFEGVDAAAYQGDTGFKDVPAGKWYSPAVKWAYESGVTSGIGEGVFGLGGTITRQQMAKFVYNYAQLCGYDIEVYEYDNLEYYEDVDLVADWAYDAMNWAVSYGLYTSTSENALILAPTAQVNRAVGARFMVQFKYYTEIFTEFPVG